MQNLGMSIHNMKEKGVQFGRKKTSKNRWRRMGAGMVRDMYNVIYV